MTCNNINEENVNLPILEESLIKNEKEETIPCPRCQGEGCLDCQGFGYWIKNL